MENGSSSRRNRGFDRQRARKRHALLRSKRQLGRTLSRDVSDADQGEVVIRGCGARSAAVAWGAARHRRRNVLARREPWEEARRLKHHRAFFFRAPSPRCRR